MKSAKSLSTQILFGSNALALILTGSAFAKDQPRPKLNIERGVYLATNSSNYTCDLPTSLFRKAVSSDDANCTSPNFPYCVAFVAPVVDTASNSYNFYGSIFYGEAASVQLQLKATDGSNSTAMALTRSMYITTAKDLSEIELPELDDDIDEILWGVPNAVVDTLDGGINAIIQAINGMKQRAAQHRAQVTQDLLEMDATISALRLLENTCDSATASLTNAKQVYQAALKSKLVSYLSGQSN